MATYNSNLMNNIIVKYSINIITFHDHAGIVRVSECTKTRF